MPGKDASDPVNSTLGQGDAAGCGGQCALSAL
jgi:hypothetical protein